MIIMKMVTFSRHAIRMSARSIRPILISRKEGIHHVKSHVRRIHHRRAGVVAMTSVGRYVWDGFSFKAVLDDMMEKGGEILVAAMRWEGQGEGRAEEKGEGCLGEGNEMKVWMAVGSE
jgi:hypothetical protein